jgi:CheY-like chemotaxis protein
MLNQPRFIFLADDDDDDRFLFQEALNEITMPTQLSSVRDGEQLMEFLATNSLPDILFLDLNMPRKDGFQCLIEIKKNEKFKKLPVIIFSTSFQPDAVDKLYENGAQYYIRKPSNFEHFKKVIHHAILLITKAPPANGSGTHQPPKEKFVLEPELIS